MTYKICLLLAVIVICETVLNNKKYKIKMNKMSEELQSYKLYVKSFEDMITEIRLKQHDFSNHLTAVYSQHKVFNTYEELVRQQKAYCNNISDDSRYVKLINAGNPVLMGFLYEKFILAEKKGIDVEYEIHAMLMETRIPVFNLVSILGNLIDNAVDELMYNDIKKLKVEILENNKEICLKVSNVHEFISEEQILNFFKKGYSQKGFGRGMGLYEIKRMSREYGFDIVCGNEKINGFNWVKFQVRIKKSVNRNVPEYGI